jgi:hypothetical protein
MATPDMIYMSVEKAYKGKATFSEALAAGEDWQEFEFSRGETYRGWISNQVGANFVFLTGGSDLYLIPRACCSLLLRGDNPILDPPWS